MDAWFCDPALDHYRQIHVCHRNKSSPYISISSVQLVSVALPTTNTNAVKVTTQQNMKNKPRRMAIKDLKKGIETIINGSVLPASEGESVATEGGQQPAKLVATSTNPTNHCVLKQKPKMHLRTTRANTPGATPTIITAEPVVRRLRCLNPAAHVPWLTNRHFK